MGLCGSKTVVINCVECGLESPKLRVTLVDTGKECLFYEKGIPEGWEIEEETELWDDPENYVLGYCPKHREAVMK